MHERRIDDDARATAMATAVLDHATNRDSTNDNETKRAEYAPTGRARYQIALTVCRRCDQAWQEGGGVQVPVDPTTLERARCDAQHIGSLDGDGPERAYQDIPPSVDRFVRRRDGGRCQTPGCRSTLGLEIHHIIHREHGGTNDPSNLTLRCSACHDAHHRGLLEITGTAPHQIVTTRVHEPAAHVGAASSGFEQAAMRSQARDALVAMGWKRAIARAAVDEASEAGSLVDLIREALRRCPQL